MNKFLFLISLALLFPAALIAQPGGGGGPNMTCETAAPFCTGTLYSFPAGVNAGVGQAGPCYSCLSTRPNPAWYYMKVANPGNIIIQMHSDPSKDIDFCCWGPFTSQNACTQLTCNKVVSCSYSPLSYETCNIPNGQTGEYYILVITNFSNKPCNIIFQQTGGTGTTDCSILPPACTSNSPICMGQTLQLSAQPVNSAVYNWWGPANFTSTLQNPSIPNATTANEGDYFLRITVNGQPSQDTSVTHAYVYNTEANAGTDTIIPNGTNTVLYGSSSGGCGSYHYHWEPASKLVNPDLQSPQTVNLFATTVFTLEVTDDSAHCIASDLVSVNIAGGALAVNPVANPSSICYGASTQLIAFGSGGAGNYTYSWTGPGGFTSNLQDPTVFPPATSTYDVAINDGYNTAYNSVTVEVIPLPVANPGPNKAIPYGTYTFLDGSGSGGSGSYFYAWTPAAMLVNASSRTPQTLNLTATTVYSLTITDITTNCVSNNQGTVSIEVTGGPLNVNPVATPPMICRGDSTQLHASAGGGNVGSYTYSWTSDPPGFTSADPNPKVAPIVNTSYNVSVNDGFNTTSGSTAVNMYPDPFIHLGPPDTTVCVFDTFPIDAGNPGSTYLWSNGAAIREILISTTGIGYDAQTYSVEVTNQHGCKAQSSITVYFDFKACTGIEESSATGRVRIWPNPSKGLVTIEATGLQRPVTGNIVSSLGTLVHSFTLPVNNSGHSILDLDLRNLTAGLYLVRFDDPAFNYSQKLVIE